MKSVLLVSVSSHFSMVEYDKLQNPAHFVFAHMHTGPYISVASWNKLDSPTPPCDAVRILCIP